MTNVVEYLMTFNAKMNGIVMANKGLQQTNELCKKVQLSAGGIGSAFNKIGGMLGTIGVGVGMFQLVNMMEKGIEKAHLLHQAQAQIKAGLISTGNAAGMTMQSIEAVANKISSASLNGRADILSMQSILLTFPGVTSKTFGTASQAITDMSTRMKTDLGSTALQVGKALQDPILGITALRRQGVSFTSEQKDIIKNLVKGGNVVGAQTMILTELNKEFGGSAKAAYDATPMAKYNKVVTSIQTAIGELGLKIQEKLAPHLESIAIKFKSIVSTGIAVVKFLYNNQALVLGLAAAFGVLTIAIKYNNIVTAISSACTSIAAAATAAWTVVTWLFSAALWSTGIPEIVLCVAALVAGIVWAYQNFGVFRGIVLGTWEALKGFGNIIMNFLVDAITGFIKGLGGIAQALLKLFSGDFQGALDTGKKAVKELLMINATDNVIKNARSAGRNISSAYQQGVNDIANKNTLGTTNDPIIKAGLQRKQQIEALYSQYHKLDGLKGNKFVNDRKTLADKMNAIRSGAFGVLNDNNYNGIRDNKESGGSGTGSGIGTGKGATEAIATGGTRNTSININLSKMVENIIFQGGIKENEQDLTKQVQEILLRTLYSAQSAG